MAVASVLLAGKIHLATRTPCASCETVARAAREVDSSTSRVNHQHPTTTKFLGPTGPWGTEGACEGERCAKDSMGRGAARTGAPMPLVQLRV